MWQKRTELGKFWWIIELLFFFSTSELGFVQLITHNKDLKVFFCVYGRNFQQSQPNLFQVIDGKMTKKMHFFNETLLTSAFFPKPFHITFFLLFTYHLKYVWCKLEVIYIDIWKVIDEYLNPTIYHKLLKVFPSGL